MGLQDAYTFRSSYQDPCCPCCGNKQYLVPACEGECATKNRCREEAAQAIAHCGGHTSWKADTVRARGDHAAHDGEGTCLLGRF